ncbi:MAG: DUF2336 domain-containing protein [Alphaproteobacteria bacterium]|nr:DUF2336 domain-containing protein [Alphaproteobacteria bacterium]
MSELSKEDLERLAADPSAQGRVAAIGKVASTWKAGSLTAAARVEAEKLLRVLAEDAVVAVRKALSDHLKDASLLPAGLAMKLARDIDQVATPMLLESEAFSDEDLMEIVASQGQAKQVAIAGRKSVSDAVAAKLVEHGDEKVAATLAGNAGARMSDATVERLVDRHGKSDAVQTKLVARRSVPLRVLEKLYNLASERIRERLLERPDMTSEMAADLAMHAREIATVDSSMSSQEEDVARLATHLHSTGRLDPGLVIRALCMGDLFLFEHGLAKRANIPIERARQLIYDPVGGLKYVYERAYMPLDLYPAVRAALEVALETSYDGGPADRERYRRRMIERVLTKVEDADPDTADYLLARLSTLTQSLAHQPVA